MEEKRQLPLNRLLMLLNILMILNIWVTFIRHPLEILNKIKLIIGLIKEKLLGLNKTWINTHIGLLMFMIHPVENPKKI